MKLFMHRELGHIVIVYQVFASVSSYRVEGSDIWNYQFAGFAFDNGEFTALAGRKCLDEFDYIGDL